MKRWLLCVLLLLVVGCGAPKLDTSSEEAMKKSVEAMEAKLNEEEKKELKTAIAAILFSKMLSAEALSDKAEPKDLLKDINGLTAKEIIAKGKEKAKEMDKQMTQ